MALQPRKGRRVQFKVWIAENVTYMGAAPKNIPGVPGHVSEWTGEVVDVEKHPSGHTYVIKRDHDGALTYLRSDEISFYVD